MYSSSLGACGEEHHTSQSHISPSPSQIYVEVPRARLTMELARIKEARNEITEAANVLQELQVIFGLELVLIGRGLLLLLWL